MDWIEIKEGGDKNKERVVFRADSDIELGYYILFIVEKVSETTFSSKPEKVFWFPDTKIKENDIIVVYTKEGEHKKKENASGNTTHFFYWGLSSEQFTGKFMPVLIEAKGWVGVQESDDEKILK